jgi:hypothetical protein
VSFIKFQNRLFTPSRRHQGTFTVIAPETEEGSVVGGHHGITSVLERENGGRGTGGPATNVP